jgi:hypothetical protein
MCRSFASFAFFLGALLLACLACSSSTSGSEGTADPSSAPTPVDGPKKGDPLDPTKDGATQIVVGVDAEPFASLGMTIGALEIITKIDGVESREIVDATKGPLFPHELRLYAPKTKLDAAVEIEVIGRDRVGGTMPAMVERLAKTQFAKGTTKLAYVLLELRCNHVPLAGGGGPYGPTCAAPTTCIAGACASSNLPPLSDYYPGWAKNPPSACGTGAPELTIAQGEKTLQPLADGATITLEQGPQCGHHMWLSLRMKNLAQAGTITTLSASQPGTGITVPATAYPYAWGASESGACDLVGLRFQLDISGATATDFLGKPLDITVQATDKAGHTVTAVRHVSIAPTFTIFPGRNCAGGPGPGGGGPGG